MKLTREALALLDIPGQHARTLPGYGWRPPDEYFVKINTDAGIVFDTMMGVAGGIARWPTGFMSLRDGVIFAKLRGSSRVVLGVDCMEIVNLWDSRAGSRSVVAPILSEVEGLASSFISFCIQHVKRAVNESMLSLLVHRR
jgi:hypothetical protein